MSSFRITHLTPTGIEYDTGDVEFVETATGVVREKGLEGTEGFHSESTPIKGIEGMEVASYAGSMDVDREKCAEKVNENESKRQYVSLLTLI